MVIDEISYPKKENSKTKTDTAAAGSSDSQTSVEASGADVRTRSSEGHAKLGSRDHSPKTKPGVINISSTAFESRLAEPIDRLAATFADLVIFVPLLAVVTAPFKRATLVAQLLGNDAEWLVSTVTAACFGVIAYLFYQTVFLSLYGATPGKRVFGIRVESVWDGKKPRPMMAFVRSIMWCFELLALGAPSLAVFSNEKRRPFHDRMGDTVVTVTGKSRAKPAGVPSVGELSVASGVSAALLLTFAVAVIVGLQRFQNELRNGATAASQLEDKGLLCRAVGDAKEEWVVRNDLKTKPAPKAEDSRLAIALALFGSDAIDDACLETEADYAIWSNQDLTLGYLAKALAHSDEPQESAQYFNKTCTLEPQSAACGLAHLVQNSETFEINVDGVLAKEEQVVATESSASLLEKFANSGPQYFKVWAIRHLMQSGEFTSALSRIDQISPHRSVGFYYAKARMRALWNLDRRDESRLVMRASLETLDNDQRIEVSQWACFNEHNQDGCTDAAKFACGLLQASVDRSERWFESPEVAATYIRGESCQGELSLRRITDLQEKMALPEAKNYLDALRLLKTNKRTQALSILKDLATDKGEASAFYIEANAELASVAANTAELGRVERAWMDLSHPSDDWHYLGLKLASKLSALKAWDKATEVGLRLIEEDHADLAVYKSLVVSAYRSGNPRLAMQFLNHFRKLEASVAVPLAPSETNEVKSESGRSQRAPASFGTGSTFRGGQFADDFAEVSHQLGGQKTPQRPLQNTQENLQRKGDES